MHDQLVHLLERAFVQQQRDALSRGKLALRVLPLPPLLPAAFLSQAVAPLEFSQ